MNLPKRTLHALLLALVCLNILVRLPSTSHETGVDSFYVHNLATAITEQGRIAWVLNPLGYFGWYPFSYPTAVPILISGVSQTADMTEEGGILVLSILYGILGALGGFIMARTFRRDDAFALLAALLFSMAPRFISFTLWSASARNLFMVFVPIFLWMLVRTSRNSSSPNFLVLVSILFMMIATHRLTILLAVVVIAFVASHIFMLLVRVLRVRFPSVLMSRSVRSWMPFMALLGVLAIATYMIVGTEVLGEYSEGEICSGVNVADRLCNLGVSITRSVGLATPLALLGAMEVVRQRNKGFIEAFLVFSLLALIPTLFLRQYTGFYILPFLALFGAYGVLSLFRILAKRPRARNAVAIASILMISGFSVGVLRIEVERSTVIPSATYSTALYLRDLPPGSFVANEGQMGVRVSAISGRSGLPVGGAGTTSQSPELLIMGAFNASVIFARENRIQLTDLTIEDDSPFYIAEINSRSDWILNVMRRDVSVVPSTRSLGVSTVERYSLQYYLESDLIPDGYYAFGNTYNRGEERIFTDSVHASRYKLYDGNFENLYLAFPPLN